ncbi:hypothetical protein Y032_0058g2880 [Ancylostoma ceylanicum]|uniref:Uncharacterized protein n=1 Tax=Ancylostoma ceylanicum TaxID=53326 RepID=A0A016U4J9_9BILA|nr:hypothetical protein Y032_0058g2880 [Ancylostoma ceylanicum]
MLWCYLPKSAEYDVDCNTKHKKVLLKTKSMYSCVAQRQYKNLQVEGSSSKDSDWRITLVFCSFHIPRIC